MSRERAFEWRGVRLGVMAILLGACVTCAVACGAKAPDAVRTEVTTESTEATEATEETPEEALQSVRETLQEEIRIFDVKDHHAALAAEIKTRTEGLTDASAIKAQIQDVVKTHMDEHFKARIGTLLSEKNPHYGQEEADALFNALDPSALYELIALYEWTDYLQGK